MPATLLTPTHRYWLPSGAAPPMDDRGWLAEPAEPRADGGRSTSPSAGSARIPSRSAPFLGRCSVLLGPGGTGKSTTLRERKALAPLGVPAVIVDLASLAHEPLEDLLLEAPAMQSWLRAEGEVCLVLDSFDEPQHRREALPQELERLLRRWPRHRLWLRIACRSADWPSFLDEQLMKAFSAGVSSWQLLPLTLTAIRQIAERKGVDANAFVAAVEQRQVGALAAAPMTLKLLLATFKTAGGLPSSTWGLYEQGLLAMTEEHSARRRHTSERDDARPTSRRVLRIARQVAAATTFSGHPRLWTSSDATAPGGAVSSDLLLDALQVEAGDSPVSRRDLGYVLRSALFQPHGSFTAWAHTTVGEHLAAAWLADLDDETVTWLLLAEDGRLAPQTSRVAAWLVLADARRFARLATVDPSAIVGQLDIPDHAVRSAVVQALFEQVVTGEELRQWSVDYRNLDHPGINAQLSAFLEDPSPDARLLAIDIGRQLQPPGLGEALSRIALDPRQPVHLRCHAIAAAGERGDAGDLALVFARPATDDDFAELVAAGLLACWPGRISTGQALQHLSSAHPRVHIGGNLDMAAHKIARGLVSDDVEAAAEFLLSAEPGEHDGHLDVVVPAAFALCADHLDVGRAAEACTTLLIQRLRSGLPPVPAAPDGSLPDIRDRRRLALLVVCAAGPTDPAQMLMVPASFGGLLGPDDREWLLDQEHRVQVRHPSVFDRFRLPADDEPAEPPSPAPPPAAPLKGLTAENRARLEEALDRCEQGLVDAFLDVSWFVSGRDVDALSLGAQNADLSQRPRWTLLTPVQRNRVLDAAEQYSAQFPPPGLQDDAVVDHRRGEEGVRALVTLAAQRPNALDSVSSEAWRLWGEPLVRWSWATFGTGLIEKRLLIERALPHARRVMEDALVASVQAAAKVNERLSLDVETRLLWSDPLADRLLEHLASGVSPTTHIDVARLLLRHAPLRVRPLLATHCTEASEEVARASAVALLQFDSRASSAAIARLVADRPSVLRQAVSSIGPLGSGPAPDVEPAVAADLVVWLMTEAGATAAGTSPRPWRRDDVFSEWAGHLVEALRMDASAAAVAALQHVVNALPENSGLRHELLVARAAHRTRAWTPIPPATLLALPRTRVRPLRNVTDLRKATVVALAEVQQLLSGEGSEARLLWDTHTGRPKEEEQVSDYLANRLRSRLAAQGVTVHREAQVQRPGAIGLGYRADLRLDAFVGPVTKQLEQVSVMIEVKGAWHPRLFGDLRDQLAERYLDPVPGAHGVYVVLWPDPADPMWRKTLAEDHRRAVVARREPTEVLQRLRHNAQDLSDFRRTIEVVIVDLSTHPRRHRTSWS